MTLSDSIKAGAGAAVLAAGLWVVYGVLSPGSEAPSGHVVLSAYPDGGTPAPGSPCLWATALADTSALALWRVDAGSARYVRAHVCAAPIDGGDANPSVPGVTVVYDNDVVDGYDGGPWFEAWTQDRADAPWKCACCPRDGGGCSALLADGGWGVAASALTYQPGAWAVDGGWVAKPCVELAGASSMPEVCR